jgi:hypothetical protein
MDLTVLLQGNDRGKETRVPLVAGIEKRDILIMFLRNLISQEPPAKNLRAQAFVMQLHLEHTLLVDVYRDF